MYLLFNHDLFTIIYIYAFLRRFAIEALAVERVPTVGAGRKGGSLAVDAGDVGRVVAVAEVHHEGTDASCHVAGGETAEQEVAALGTDAGTALRIVELVAGAEVEDALVIGIEAQLLVRA